MDVDLSKSVELELRNALVRDATLGHSELTVECPKEQLPILLNLFNQS